MGSVTEERFRALEARVNRIEEMQLAEHDQQIRQILRLVTKHEGDIAELRQHMDRRFAEVDRRFEEMGGRFEELGRSFDQLRSDLPDIIAKAVAPLLKK